MDFAAPHLKRFLQTIATMKPRKIHVIAHSMGNLVLVRALEKLAADSGAVPPPLAEIINANPDVDPDLYSEFVKRLKESKGTNITLYASGSDKALWVSSGLRSVARAGYISDGWEPTPGADAIDITGAGARLFSFNHDVYASDRLLAQDMRGILRGERPPEQRTTQFKRMNSAHGAYWKYQRPAAGVQ